MPLKTLQGKVSIITGASRGVGAATARTLAAAGSDVVLTARDEAWLETVTEDVENRGSRAIAVPADITDPDMVEEVVESALGRFDRVDILVNCLGMVWPVDAAVDVDANEWAYSVHVNLIAPFTMVNNVLPIMVEQGSGRIVNLTCHSGHTPRTGESALRAGKAGLEMWTHVVGVEVEGTGVTIACLDPGLVDTATRRELIELDIEDGVVDISAWLPEADEAELLRPDEIARMIFWMVGPWSIDERSFLFNGLDEEWRARVQRDLSAIT